MGENKMNIRNWSKRFGLGAAALSVLAILGSMVAEPAWAQVRAAMVRDVDAPALAPATFRASLNFIAINQQALITTVPTGKRLVIENVSYFSSGANEGQLILLGLRNSEFGAFVLYAPINPPHVSADSRLSIQDGSFPTTVYFEAGQQVWLSASRSNGSLRDLTVIVTGHYVTL